MVMVKRVILCRRLTLVGRKVWVPLCGSNAKCLQQQAEMIRFTSGSTTRPSTPGMRGHSNLFPGSQLANPSHCQLGYIHCMSAMQTMGQSCVHYAFHTETPFFKVDENVFAYDHREFLT